MVFVDGSVTIDKASDPGYRVGDGSCIDAAVGSGVCGAEVMVILGRAGVPVVVGFEHAEAVTLFASSSGVTHTVYGLVTGADSAGRFVVRGELVASSGMVNVGKVIDGVCSIGYISNVDVVILPNAVDRLGITVDAGEMADEGVAIDCGMNLSDAFEN
jgi:hypothetical protein